MTHFIHFGPLVLKLILMIKRLMIMTLLKSRGPFYDIFHPPMFRLMLMIMTMNDNAVEK